MGKKNPLSFPHARVIPEGYFSTPQGDLVSTTYVDLTGKLILDGLCLAKVTEPRFALSTTKSIRLSRPGVFRDIGEELVKDEQEGLARRETRETVHSGSKESILAKRRARALNAALCLGNTKISVKSNPTESINTHTMTFGTDWLIYCTSILPAEEEEKAWRRTFPPNYTKVSRIYRPVQFAQALGIGICENIGATGKAVPVHGTFYGFKTVETHRASQLVVHGPVLYVDDPHSLITGTEIGWERICSAIFVKSTTYEKQKEYRFAMLQILPEVGDVFDLPVSGMLQDCLKPVKFPVSSGHAEVKLSRNEAPGGTEKETFRSYTRRRRTTKQEELKTEKGKTTTNWLKEEIVEETTVSPDEIKDPNPSDEQPRPDVIIVHQVGRKFRLVHNAYRNELINHWRIETQNVDPIIVEDFNPSDPIDELKIPTDLMLESETETPIHPGFILDLCLNPSIPRPPREYKNLERCGQFEIKHILACGEALNSAIEQVPNALQEAAAASSWQAFLFIRGLVSSFGPIVKGICIIRECIAVVELNRAPFSGTIAWTTFSGTGTYTIHIYNRSMEATTFSGETQHAGPLNEHTYVKTLQKYGWPLKHQHSET